MRKGVTGYITHEPLVVFDATGVPFYAVSEALLKANKGRVKFNLPPVSFTVQPEGAAVKQPRPFKWQSKGAPRRNRFNPKPPKQFSVRYEDNPNKCSINLATGIIIADHSIKAMPLHVRTFIFLHELGHYFYQFSDPMKTESACDLFAASEMLKAGFNPSQVMSAPRLSLSEKSEQRKTCVRNFAQATQHQ